MIRCPDSNAKKIKIKSHYQHGRIFSSFIQLAGHGMQEMQIHNVVEVHCQPFEKCQTLHQVLNNPRDAISHASPYGHPSEPQQVKNNKLR